MDRDQARDVAAAASKNLDIERKNHEVDAVKWKKEREDLRIARDGYEAQFKDTSNSLTALESSHKLTREGLEKKTAEAEKLMTDLLKSGAAQVEVQKENHGLIEKLDSAKEKLAEVRQQLKACSGELEKFSKNYEIVQKNQAMLKTALGRATEKIAELRTSIMAVLTLQEIC